MELEDQYSFFPLPPLDEDDISSSSSIQSQLKYANPTIILCRNICRRDIIAAILENSLKKEELIASSNLLLCICFPLILAYIVRLFILDKKKEFEEILEVLSLKVHNSRVLKIRFMLMLHSGNFLKEWKVKLKYKPHCYPNKSLELGMVWEALEEATVSSIRARKELANSNVVIDFSDPKKIETVFMKFVKSEMFHPDLGIKLGINVYRTKPIKNSFVASDGLNYLTTRLKINRVRAVQLFNVLNERGIIKRAVNPSKSFKDNQAIWVYDLVDEHDESNSSLSDTDNVIHFELDVDLIDIQTYDFWTKEIFDVEPTKGKCFGFCTVVHPLLSHLDEQMPSLEHKPHDWACNCYREGSLEWIKKVYVPEMEQLGNRPIYDYSLASCAYIPHVFSSIARPYILTLRDPIEHGDLAQNQSYVEISPNFIVKTGDNLNQDMAVEMLFRAFNGMWSADTEMFPDARVAPISITYEVIPTGDKKGFMEAVTGVTPLKEFDWDEWHKKYKDDDDVITSMVASAAGSYVAAYVVGARDRHWDNILVKDERYLMQIDFGFVMGNQAPIDGPRFSISPNMEAIFKKLDVWDVFVDLCCDAFRCIRRSMLTISQGASLVFTIAGFNEKEVENFVRGPQVFNEQASEDEAVAVIRKKVLSSSSDVLNMFKQYSHQNVDPLFYSMLEKRFPPAVLIMKMVEAGNRPTGVKDKDTSSKSKERKNNFKKIFMKKNADKEGKDKEGKDNQS